ncbi:MAG: aminopeptidase P N-terminal domain-containing protein [Campylobacterota bacterium]|nr:aminopeptidase P N-terminal domain-containing protein [Campylobacterota bacterium]
MIQESEYKKRRDLIAKKLVKNSLAVLFSNSYKNRSNDTDYPYRQDSNFYYLSGFKEDNSALVIFKSATNIKTILFVEKKERLKELWNGKRVGRKKAKKRFLFDEVYDYSEFESKLKELMLKIKTLYFDFKLDYSKVKVLKRYAKNLPTHKNIAPLVASMRLIKSDAEIKLIEKAISITQDAHHKVISLDKDGLYEYHLQSEMEYVFKNSGAYSDAYTSIVASGNSANTLHYISNDKILLEDSLILIDAGCEYEYYASDITRTIPVSGQFSDAQKELYEMVLDVQLKIIAMIKPDEKRTLLQEKAEILLTQGMIRLGILKGSYKKLLKKKKHKKYYPHGIGHWMGLDVHDMAPYKDENDKEIPLKKGMVLTIEPGIYISKNDKCVPKKFRGLGIRIEDDILVTKNGNKNLSSNIAKTVDEIEKLSFTISTSKNT